MNPDTPSRKNGFTAFWFIITFIFVSAAVYSNTLDAPFVLDGKLRIHENPHVRVTELSFRNLRGAATQTVYNNRPVPMLSFALNYRIHQYRTPGYVSVNIAIHIINTILIYFLFKITLDLAGSSANRFVPFAAALFWCAHPLHTESVTYIVQRMTSMGAMFYLLSLLCYIKARLIQRHAPESGRKYSPLFWFTGSALAFLLALGSKENTIMLLFVLILYEWFFFQDMDWSWLKKASLFIGTGVLLLLIMAILYRGGNPLDSMTAGYQFRDFTMPQRVMTEWRVVMYYISQIFFPHPYRLNLEHDYPLSFSLTDPFTTIPSLAAIIALFSLAAYIARENRIFSFAILWYLINLIIESSVIELEIIFEHRTYLPSMFLFLSIVLGVCRIVPSRWLKGALFFVLAVLLAAGTYVRNGVLSDETRLWEDCVRKSPAKVRPLVNLGNALLRENRTEEAIRLLRRAIGMSPDDEYAGYAHNGLANALLAAGKEEDALRHYRLALVHAPGDERIHYNLGLILARRGEVQDAVTHLERALELDPEYADVYIELGNILAGRGDPDRAIQACLAALRIDPDHENALFNIGLLHHRADRPHEALPYVRRLISINPRYPRVLDLHNAVMAGMNAGPDRREKAPDG